MAKNDKTRVRRRGRLARNIGESQVNDYFLFNNAVLVQGYAMAPLIGGAVNLRFAMLLTLGGVLLIIPIGILGEILTGVVKKQHRLVMCVLITSLLIIPEMILMSRLFGADAISVGLYLPLLFVEGIITFRATDEIREGFLNAFRRSLMTALAYSVAILASGAVSEILGSGTILGRSLPFGAVWPAAATAPGGLILIALFAAFWNMIRRVMARLLFTEVDDNA